MDWMTGISGIVVLSSIVVAAGVVWKAKRMKEETDLFADQVEETIGQILSGKEWKETEEIIEDTLWGEMRREVSAAVSRMESERNRCLA